ncbi:MAG: signal peptidase II [Acidimicrobiales bacterium]
MPFTSDPQTGASPAAPTPARRRLGVVGAIVAGVVAIDQSTKSWALMHLVSGPRHVIWTFRLALEFNSGVAFSQATGATTIVTVVGLVVLCALVAVAWRTSGTFTAVVLGLMIGGAVGNLVDRLIRQHGGAVIDFIDPQWFPVFNVADSALTIGVILALGRSVLSSRDRQDA